MNLCADSWFLIKLSENDTTAMETIKQVTQGKDRLIVPSVTLVELTRKMIRDGSGLENVDKLLGSLRTSSKITVTSLDEELAVSSGKISAEYSMPSIDSIVAATALRTECRVLLSKDTHFDRFSKSTEIKKQCW